MIDTDTWFKFAVWSVIILVLLLSGLLWLNTPELFEYFNMAFCAH
ncbi:hypothetical protein [Acinetobacter nematophilus]|uniref:Signal pepetide n=1 Tax=Acinetobacter nematophilus TaxID=2994642 RepID=A0A9X3IF17_9GAMM|nr:hypothetical protein [Acinetobacter nematophilus]MCX5466298.1 hypothetical protein [Acinetobacter nematophilus]